MTVADSVPHGSPKGYALGCRSKGGCLYHRDPTTLTCVEAMIAARGDHVMAELPMDQPRPRWSAQVKAKQITSSPPVPEKAHGTVWRYRQGCTDSRRCPHWRMGRVTCAEARRSYFADYHARRRSGDGTPLAHGTSAGYLSGCRTASACPRDQDGRSCHDARVEYRRRRARARGISAPPPTVTAREAARLVAELTQASLTGREIARLTGVGRSTIARLLTAHETNGADGLNIREATLEAIRSLHANREGRFAPAETTRTECGRE